MWGAALLDKMDLIVYHFGPIISVIMIDKDMSCKTGEVKHFFILLKFEVIEILAHNFLNKIHWF